MSVSLNPPELGFRRPFNHEVTQLLRLGNHSNDPIAFKVKTTAPKQYCVRPNSGRIEVGSEVEVQVLLQAMREDPPLDARCRDKFLVQSIAITPERDLGSVTTINVEKIAKEAIEEKKIRVVFLPADGTAETPNHKQVNGLVSLSARFGRRKKCLLAQHPVEDAPPAYGSGTPSYGSPHQEAVTPNTRSIPTESRPSTDTKSVAESLTNAAASASSTMGVAASSVAHTFPTSSEELKAQLAQAKDIIASLTSQVEEQGLRQRKMDAVNQDSRERITTGTTGMGVQQQPADGVPVQIVAALCLLSFLLAYFFF
ncbi:MAG: hypothetical protein Q9217_004641 [Psora testacea]